jgi:2-phosphosulfolactate phosphatase
LAKVYATSLNIEQLVLDNGKSANITAALEAANLDFANIDALCERLLRENRDVVLLCSGWQNDFCLEDTLVAGAIIHRLGGVHGDAAAMSLAMWQQAKSDPYAYCQNATHVHRLQAFGPQAQADIEFAFKMNICPVVPVLKKGILML